MTRQMVCLDYFEYFCINGYVY